MISTSVFQSSNPKWYLKGKRNLMLIYDIQDPNDVIAMFPTDSNTICNLEVQRSNEAYVEKLLIGDGVEDAWFSTLYPDHQCAYTFKQLTEKNEICEIILRKSVHPKGILVGDLEWYKQNTNRIFETEIFAAYYQLPIYVFEDGKVRTVPNGLLSDSI